jgi:antitoxin (DNA-binding transcriptional repressor) of toxin-antitoxin stability system
MINKQYSITQVPNYWTDIMKRVEQGDSIQLTRNSEVIAMLIPALDKAGPKQNFWQTLQRFRQQIDIAELYDEDIFSDVRDHSPGREVLYGPV